MPKAPGSLLRLVYSLERRRAGRAYTVVLTLRRVGDGGPAVVLASSRQVAQGPRAFVIGTGERVDLAVPGGLMPRHVAVVTTPRTDGVVVRLLSLHPDRGVQTNLLPRGLAATPTGEDHGGPPEPIGGLAAKDAARIRFDGLELEVTTELDAPEAPFAPQLLETYPVGGQLAFHAGPPLRPVGDSISSISGPEGGGHAIPALLSSSREGEAVGGSLVLRARTGAHRVDVEPEQLRRGVLIGRSRRCVLGRGFDENDGLSRVHALVIRVDGDGAPGGVYALDLASRYGLRDVSRPSRLLTSARLDDGIGCLVYGAGYLTYEG